MFELHNFEENGMEFGIDYSDMEAIQKIGERLFDKISKENQDIL